MGENEITIQDMPNSMHDLARVVGADAAWKLIKHYGGVRIWTPVNPKPDHPLVILLGSEKAHALCSYCGADYLTVPRAAAGICKTRNAQISARYTSGVTARTLALEYGLTERSIFKIVSNARTSKISVVKSDIGHKLEDHA